MLRKCVVPRRDFGHCRPSLTVTNELLGTLDFMSPEVGACGGGEGGAGCCSSLCFVLL